MARRRTPLDIISALFGVWLLAFSAVETQSPLKDTADWINTRGYEDSPFLSPDGNSVYFMYTPWTVWPVFYGLSPVLIGPERAGHNINPGQNPWEDSDIYVSRRLANGRWSPPENLAFNDENADCCAMTWDGRRFAYQRTQWAHAAITDIYLVELNQDGRTWTRQSAGPNVNSPQHSESNAHLTPDGQLLLFTSDRPGGHGGRDLYLSRLRGDGTWGPAENLGPPFNTASDEDQIWLSRNGRTVYFSREPGPHILVSTWDGRRWQEPRPVLFNGRMVAGAEVSVTDDGRTMLFAEVRPDLEDIVIVAARKKADGTWGSPVPIDVP